MTTVTTDAETIVRRAYHAAEGNVMDVQGFVDLFASDGVINMGHAGQEFSGISDATYRGDQLGEIVLGVAKFLPDVHRELHRVNVLGDVVAVELSIRGTYNAPPESAAASAQPSEAKADYDSVRGDLVVPYRLSQEAQGPTAVSALSVLGP